MNKSGREEEAKEEEEEEEEARTLLVVREVTVYKIPARSTSGGYKCGEWLQSDKIWSGRLRLVSRGAKCDIRLEDSNTGELFATCPVEAGKREATVENVLDSSRYFVLKVDDGRGRHAFIGLGFSERNDAFDFNVALSDHEKYVKRDHDADASSPSSSSFTPHQSLDLRLKDGETIKINVKTRAAATSGGGVSGSSSSGGSGMMKNTAGVAAVMSSTGRMAAPLAPPPGGGRIRSPLPPPPSDTSTTATAVAAATNKKDPLSDLSQLQGALPSSTKNSSGAGWAAF